MKLYVYKKFAALPLWLWRTWNEYRGNLGFRVIFHMLKCCILSKFTQHLGEREVQSWEFSTLNKITKYLSIYLLFKSTIWCNSNQLINGHIKLCWLFHTPGHIPVPPFLLLHSLQTSKEKYFVFKLIFTFIRVWSFFMGGGRAKFSKC